MHSMEQHSISSNVVTVGESNMSLFDDCLSDVVGIDPLFDSSLSDLVPLTCVELLEKFWVFCHASAL